MKEWQITQTDLDLALEEEAVLRELEQEIVQRGQDKVKEAPIKVLTVQETVQTLAQGKDQIAVEPVGKAKTPRTKRKKRRKRVYFGES